MTDTKPTLAEQIAAQEELIVIHKRDELHEAEIEMDDAILASLKELAAIKSQPVPVEPTIYTKTFLRGSTMEEHDVVLKDDYDTLLSAYKLMRGKHAIEKQNAIHYKAMFEQAESALQVAQMERDKCAMMNDDQSRRVYAAEAELAALRLELARLDGEIPYGN